MALFNVIKYEGDNSTFVWKYPVSDFNTLSQLIVHENQEAIFFKNGQEIGRKVGVMGDKVFSDVLDANL